MEQGYERPTQQEDGGLETGWLSLLGPAFLGECCRALPRTF